MLTYTLDMPHHRGHRCCWQGSSSLDTSWHTKHSVHLPACNLKTKKINGIKIRDYKKIYLDSYQKHKILHHLSCKLMSRNFSMYKHFNNLELISINRKISSRDLVPVTVSFCHQHLPGHFLRHRDLKAYFPYGLSSNTMVFRLYFRGFGHSLTQVPSL